MADNPMHAWRAHTGGTAWPTVVLAIGALGLWGGTVVAHASGAVSIWLAIPCAALGAYLAFTPLHEAVHGNVGGKDRPWLDTAVGWACGVPLFAPFPGFRLLHLRHHRHTNHPDDDPDMWVAATGLAMVGRCMTLMFHYDRMLFRLTRSGARGGASVRASTLAFYAVYGLVGLALAWAGAAWALVVVALAAWIATSVLAFLFDWLPHHPHAEQGRYIDTRAIPSKALEWAMLAQNLHLVHHLWPSVPFYRYAAVFRACRHALGEQGSEVGGPTDEDQPLRAA